MQGRKYRDRGHEREGRRGGILPVGVKGVCECLKYRSRSDGRASTGRGGLVVRHPSADWVGQWCRPKSGTGSSSSESTQVGGGMVWYTRGVDGRKNSLLTKRNFKCTLFCVQTYRGGTS